MYPLLLDKSREMKYNIKEYVRKELFPHFKRMKEKKEMTYDVAVIGAGVVGGMIARTLSAYQLNLCILEKSHDVATGASCANSAIVHAGFDAKEGSLKAKLNVCGSEMMAEVCKELGVMQTLMKATRECL